MKTFTCRGCGLPIIWIRTQYGKSMPCDPEQVVYWQSRLGLQKIVTPNGEVVNASLEGDPQLATGIGYISHFATCPKAGEFRRKRDGQEVS